jgi:ribonuclease Z
MAANEKIISGGPGIHPERLRQGASSMTGCEDRGQLRVTILGSGTPTPRPDRFGSCVLIEAGSQKLLVDAGRGASIRLWQLKIPLGRIDALFITHFHSDHISGIPDLWLTGWLAPAWGQRKTPFRVIGPTGSQLLMSKLEEAYALDINIRLQDEKMPIDGIKTDVMEFDRDGVVYEKDGLVVTAFEVDHGEVIKPAFGYRFDYRGRSAVLSSDTRYHPNVVKHSMGADLLIHEVGAARPELMQIPSMKRILDHHTTPQDAASVFNQAKPKLAAYIHMVLPSTDDIPAVTVEQLVAETRRYYRGPLEIGEDLMSFDIGDTVIVRRFATT